MVSTMINQHYLHRTDAMYKICYETKYTANYLSDQQTRCADES